MGCTNTLKIGRTVFIGYCYKGEKEIRECEITDRNVFFYTATMKTDSSKTDVFSDEHLNKERRFSEIPGEWEQYISTDKNKVEEWLKTK